MSNTAKIEAEIQKLIADAQLANMERELATLDVVEKQIEVARDIRQSEFEDTLDFHNRYVVWNDDVDDTQVEIWKQQLRRLARINLNPIVVELNTRGGSIVDGFSLFDEVLRIRKLGIHVTIRVQGQAASMGAVLLQAADKREIGENSLIMIHRAAFGALGKAYEIEDELEFVRKLESQISGIFAKRSGRPVDDFRKFFDKRKDVWFTAAEALAEGLVDEVN